MVTIEEMHNLYLDHEDVEIVQDFAMLVQSSIQMGLQPKN